MLMRIGGGMAHSLSNQDTENGRDVTEDTVVTFIIQALNVDGVRIKSHVVPVLAWASILTCNSTHFVHTDVSICESW